MGETETVIETMAEQGSWCGGWHAMVSGFVVVRRKMCLRCDGVVANVRG